MQFTRKFPFIRFYKQLTSEDYHDAQTTNVIVNDAEVVKTCKNQLIDNNIPLTKIRFISESSFTYDVNNDVINPTYKIIMPKKQKHPVIEIGKPESIMTVFLGENRTNDNYDLLKKILKKSKRGVVLQVGTDYEEVMWLTNLDNAVEFYNESRTLIDYES